MVILVWSDSGAGQTRLQAGNAKTGPDLTAIISVCDLRPNDSDTQRSISQSGRITAKWARAAMELHRLVFRIGWLYRIRV